MGYARTAVAPTVADWTARRTGTAGRWTPWELAMAKARTGRRVSVVLPARNEEATVGAIVESIVGNLVDRVPLVDDVVVVDSRSDDSTAAVAAAAGARVVGQDEMTRGLPRLEGKGDALWAGLAATDGDLIAFVDADLREFQPAFVTGLLGPLLTDESVSFVKGFYHRPLVRSSDVEADAGGRVTEIMARPLFNLFWPDLSGFVQPLAGEYAGRRDVLEQIPFVSGYGVETAMLIDLLDVCGLDSLAQVDLGERRHRHQSTEALGRMSAQILLTAWSRLYRKGWVISERPPGGLLTQFRRGEAEALSNLEREIVVSDVSVQERPPLGQHRRALATTAAAG
ncbi:glucosyl-3-phosphoglycerate synthase [Solwaraspora sp. WMMB762]|uniref:glucosyl-3-phosphoglycerate synthase n=1 Tax=Solwaraspora sp. WMMB762 TaxID=3404120 RepID=UPI003B942B9E